MNVNTAQHRTDTLTKSLLWMLLALTWTLLCAPQSTLAQDAVITPDNAAELVTVEQWGRGTVRDVAWSADGQRSAVLTTAGVWLYDSAAESPRLFPATDRMFYEVDISPDGRWLAAGSWETGLHLWDTVDGVERALPEPVGGSSYTHWIKAVAFSADSRSLAAGDYDGWAHVWTLDENGLAGAPISIELGYTEIAQIAFSPDGRTLAAAQRQTSASPTLWDIASGTRRSMDSPNRDVTALAYSPDGARIAAGTFMGYVLVWNAATGALQSTLTGLSDFVTSVSFSGDGQGIGAIDIGGAAHWWALDGGEAQRWAMVGETVPNAIVVAPDPADGAALRVAVSQLDELRLWTLSPGSADIPEPVVRDGFNWTLWSLAIHPDGVHFATGDRDGTGHIGAPFADVVRLWAAGQAEPLKELKGHEWLVTNLDFGGDGAQLLTGSQDNTARLWTFPDGALVEAFDASEQTLRSTALSGDGQWAATASFDETVRLWDVAAGAPGATLLATRVLAAGFSADSQRLLALDDKGSLWQWDIPGIADGDAPTQTVALAERNWSSGLANTVAFRPEAGQVALGFSDGSVNVWDVNSGARLAALVPVVENCYPNGIESIAWSPDGALIASGDSQGELRLWDAAEQRVVAVLLDHADWITDLAFSRDGSQLFSVSWDGIIRRWALPS